MTTRRKQRGRRSLAAVAAAVLMASVLAAVAGAPAQAANTAAEVLLDANQDGVGDTRQFGGRDRYDTALRLAKQFADSRGGLGSVTNVFLASGHSLVDAVSVAGLAGSLDAPVLLTPTDRLHGGVADFIQDHGASGVYILGGTAAVSAGVEEAVAALQHKPDVVRIAGADRYETAAMIAGRLGFEAYWCGRIENSAVLVNGATDSLMDAVAVSPIANRLQLPMLMTAAGELPEATASFIRRHDVEFVAIIGNEAAVSRNVENALAAAGVDTVKRFAGSSAAGTSAVLADLVVNGDCSFYVDPAPHTVALVDRDGLPDGITAAPVLNRSLNSVSGLVPVLIVGDSLPSAVRAYLAATPAEQNGQKTRLNILAIGGTAAVSQSVMNAALSAAASAPNLTVAIVSENDHDGDGKYDDRVRAGEDSFTLNFSDDIDGTSLTTLTQKLLDITRLDGAPLVLDATTPIVYGAGGTTTSSCEPDTVTVNLQSALRGSQRISVATTTLRFGANLDLRGLVGTNATVQTTSSPIVGTPIGVIGDTNFFVTVTDDDGFSHTQAITTIPKEITFTPGVNNNVTNPTLTVGTPTANALSGSPETVTERMFTIPLTGGTLKKGDKITIEKGAIVDIGGKESSVKTSGTLATAVASPSLSVVRVSSHVDSGQAKFVVPTEITGGNESALGGASLADIFFTAKKGGAADGIDGNDWSFHFRPASTYNPPTAKGKALDVDVYVDRNNKRVFITFNDGEGTFSDLREKLEANRDFNDRWAVSVDPKIDTDHCVAADNALRIAEIATNATDHRLNVGSVMMAIEAVFSTSGNGKYPVKEAYTRTLLDDILAGTFDRINSTAVDNSDEWVKSSAVTGLWADNSSTAAITALPTADTPHSKRGPLAVVRYEVEVTDTNYLPRKDDKVAVAAGTSATNAIAKGYDATSTATEYNKATETGKEIKITTTGATAPKPTG